MLMNAATARSWQHSWDLQQERYLPYRETALMAQLAMVGPRDRVLDLAGGVGSLSRRLLTCHPDIQLTMLDCDPVLLAIARSSLPSAVDIVNTDLSDSAWVGDLPRRRFDVVVVSAALHCFAAERRRALYSEIAGVLVPGGIFCDADIMPDPQIPELAARANPETATGGTWAQWWDDIAADPVLGALPRPQHSSADWYPPVDWHLGALRDAGFAAAGILWRHGDAAVIAARTPR